MNNFLHVTMISTFTDEFLLCVVCIEEAVYCIEEAVYCIVEAVYCIVEAVYCKITIKKVYFTQKKHLEI